MKPVEVSKKSAIQSLTREIFVSDKICQEGGFTWLNDFHKMEDQKAFSFDRQIF